MWDEVDKGKWFIGFQMAVSYRNIFGEPEITTGCLMYYREIKKFLPCPVSVPELGFVPSSSHTAKLS
jgi:hypothetical protein